MKPLHRAHLIRDSAIKAVVNLVINGVINYFLIRKSEVHAVTADSITSGGSDTVIGQSVFLAVSLAIIFTLLGFKSHRAQLPGVTWSEAGRLSVMNAIYAFGIVIIAGVLWQKVFPGLTVGTVTAASIAGGIAGVVCGITHYTTLSTLAGRVK